MNVQRVRQAIAAAGIAIVLLAIGAGLVALRSPGEERVRRLDDRRIADLRSLAGSVNLFVTRNGRLPESLDELASVLGPAIPRADPATGEPYSFRSTGERRYELCATFERPSAPPVRGNFWSHREGRHCFTLDTESVKP